MGAVGLGLVGFRVWGGWREWVESAFKSVGLVMPFSRGKIITFNPC